MPTLVTVTQPASNEIILSSSYLQAQGSVARLGASQIEHTSATKVKLSRDVWGSACESYCRRLFDRGRGDEYRTKGEAS
jgi:hypothetical protein